MPLQTAVAPHSYIYHAAAGQGAAAAAAGAAYLIDGKDMGPVLRGETTQSQHDVFLHYCGFTIVAARVFGRWKVWWAMQVCHQC